MAKEIKHNCKKCRFIRGAPVWSCMLLAVALKGHRDNEQKNILVTPHKHCPMVLYFNEIQRKNK